MFAELQRWKAKKILIEIAFSLGFGTNIAATNHRTSPALCDVAIAAITSIATAGCDALWHAGKPLALTGVDSVSTMVDRHSGQSVIL